MPKYRLQNEMIRWVTKEKKSGVYRSCDIPEQILRIYYKKLGGLKDIEFILDCSDSYPFRYPKIVYKINEGLSKNILELIRIKTCGGREELLEISEYKCLCCMTILCEANWAPSYNIDHIMEELEHFVELRMRIRNRLYLNLLLKNYEGFPEDVYGYIKSYL